MNKPEVRFYPQNTKLMETYTSDPLMKVHKIGTDEYYNPAIDVIVGILPDGKTPYGKYNYELVPKTQEDLDLEQKIKEMTERHGGINNDSQHT